MIQLIHKVKLFRIIAKIVAANIILFQKFYGGRIYFNAVDHSWAWTNNTRFQNFDKYLQTKIISLSYTNEIFIDIGCNVGGIGLGVMLSNKSIQAIFIDANKKAIKCLNRSIAYNKLHDRSKIINTVANCNTEVVNFSTLGSVIGHVNKNGKEKIASINIWKLLNDFEPSKKILVKIDIEGFETELFGEGFITPQSDNISFLIELHPKGFNNLGNPMYCLSKLQQYGYKSFDLEGQEINEVSTDQISQIIFKK